MRYRKPRITSSPPLSAQALSAIRGFGEIASRSTVPLYTRVSDINTDPAIQGTGTLLRLGSYHFLLTAAHVADLSGKEGRTLCLRRAGPGMQFMSLSSGMGYFSTGTFDEMHPEAPADVAVISLPAEFAHELEAAHTFLTLKQLDPADQYAPHPSAYQITGFPSEMSTPGATLFNQQGMVYGGAKYSGDLKAIPRFHPEVHVAIGLDRENLRDSDGFHRELPDLGGASGGGIWRTLEAGRSAREVSPTEARLVGLLTRWEKNPSVCIGTQIEFVLGLISTVFPATLSVLRLYVPDWIRPGWRPHFLTRGRRPEQLDDNVGIDGQTGLE